MTTPSQNTKIARVVDAISSLVLEISLGKKVALAEDELAASLRDFLVPALRIIDCEEQGISETQVVCRTCHEAKPCKLNCAAWAASIRAEATMEVGDNGNAA